MNKNQVSIIIPCYNKADTIARAINSAINQTYQNIEVIVVDDGSTDDSFDVIKKTIRTLNNYKVSYLATRNQGVANARNNGILSSQGEFVVCLDADDWIEPTFIETCVKALIDDRTLGIAYTKLMTHLPDDTNQISQWPGKFNADKQFNYKARQNQIPTCCVFRREGFDRVGGYRQRYAPKGAGSEDAAFWTALLATGYTAKLVTNKPLFNYTAFSGNVSGNRDYQEKNWLAFYPYTKTGKHPFLSPATPEKIAHIVRDYSEPVISVIVPVGEGHEQYLQDCIDSVEAQEYWQWELIIIDDTPNQAIDTLWFMSAYPYAKIIKTGGKKGTGVARNMGANKSQGHFLFFLDADDMLNPAIPDAFEKMLTEYQHTKNGIYTAYLGRSIIKEDDLAQLAPNLQKNIVGREDNDTWIYHRVYDYKCQDAVKQPDLDAGGNIYLWCNISTLIPRAWHNEIGGFDESMSTWEDIDYWWRMAKAGKCFSKLDDAILIYRFYSSTRREMAHEKEGGVPKWQNMVNYLTEKYKEVEIMSCNCGSKNKKNTVKLPEGLVQSQTSELQMNDNDFVLIEFHFPGEQRGNYGKKLHSYTGKLGPNGRPLEYGGYTRRAGDKFYVHKDDQAARPDMFILATPELEVKAEAKPEQATPPPTLETKELEAPQAAFDFESLPLNMKQKEALWFSGNRTPEAIQDLGIDGIKALNGFGAVSAKKLLKYLAE